MSLLEGKVKHNVSLMEYRDRWVTVKTQYIPYAFCIKVATDLVSIFN